ncbi:MAG: hypothetical protein JO316_10685 [Abitibacteriaceae bacterium]|nr:hypothetical protein [Abditibacteriaceae bacterium]MBV9865809.1 hypothetical protein [Abditibacteriaceae bacterium]
MEYEIWQRSVLYLYDPTGTLVYEEVLPEAGAAVKAVALNNASTETLLVGGVNQVWQYH